MVTSYQYIRYILKLTVCTAHSASLVLPRRFLYRAKFYVQYYVYVSSYEVLYTYVASTYAPSLFFSTRQFYVQYQTYIPSYDVLYQVPTPTGNQWWYKLYNTCTGFIFMMQLHTKVYRDYLLVFSYPRSLSRFSFSLVFML